MKTKRIVLSCSERRKLRRSLRKINDADTRLRYLIVLRADDGMTSTQIASHLDRDPSTVRRVIRRFIDHGEAGLIDRREDNGDRKIDDYCPDDNRIERCVWRELHANVTVNHRCQTMQELLSEVRAWLRTFNRKKRHAA